VNRNLVAGISLVVLGVIGLGFWGMTNTPHPWMILLLGLVLILVGGFLIWSWVARRGADRMPRDRQRPSA
jgi:hypothetical protein